MKFLVLRDDDPPDEAAVVIRGGEQALSPETVRRSAARNLTAFGFLGLSVYLALDESVEDLCRTTDELRRYGQVRLSTVDRLHVAGFALLATGVRPHFDIVLADLTDPTIGRLADAFDPPERNPGRPR